MPLSPRARERLLDVVDRPLGFYLTLLIVGLVATSVARNQPAFAATWPGWLVWIVAALAVVALIALGIVLVWLLRIAAILTLRGLRAVFRRFGLVP